MQLLNLGQSKAVGDAYKYLLALRMEEGPLGEEEATRRLLEWWKKQA